MQINGFHVFLKCGQSKVYPLLTVCPEPLHLRFYCYTALELHKDVQCRLLTKTSHYRWDAQGVKGNSMGKVSRVPLFFPAVICLTLFCWKFFSFLPSLSVLDIFDTTLPLTAHHWSLHCLPESSLRMLILLWQSDTPKYPPWFCLCWQWNIWFGSKLKSVFISGYSSSCHFYN